MFNNFYAKENKVWINLSWNWKLSNVWSNCFFLYQFSSAHPKPNSTISIARDILFTFILLTKSAFKLHSALTQTWICSALNYEHKESNVCEQVDAIFLTAYMYGMHAFHYKNHRMALTRDPITLHFFVVVHRHSNTKLHSCASDAF